MKRISRISSRVRGIILITVFLLIVSLNTLPLTAALGEETKVPILTLEEALQITAEKNRDIQKALEYRKQVEAIYITERSAALPQIFITAYAVNSRDESQKALGTPAFVIPLQFSGVEVPLRFPAFQGPVRTNARSAEIQVSQSLFTWGQIGAAIRAAKVGMETAEDQLRIFRQAAFRDVSASFYDILLTEELHAITSQNLEQKNRHYDEAQKKYAAGVATDYDVLSAKVDFENAQPAVIQTENLIRISKERLRFLLGTDANEVGVKGTMEPQISPYPDYQEAEEIAYKNRPELSGLRHRKQIAEEFIKIAQSGDKPRLDFKGGFGWRDLYVSVDQQANGKAWSAGLFVTYPIFDGLRTRGQVAQAKSNLASLKIDEAKLLDAIRLEVRDAVNGVRESGEIIKALSGTVARAERLLTMAEKGYEYGVNTKLVVDDAELNVVQAKGNLARAKRDYLVACVNLERATGTLGEKEPRCGTSAARMNP
jgi:HAE1 family hydrophobic/amphiphilic exporter-1